MIVFYVHANSSVIVYFVSRSACSSNPFPTPRIVIERQDLANSVRLASLALQRVLLVLVFGVIVLRLPTRSAMVLHVLGMLVYGLLVHLTQCIQGQFDIGDQRIAPRSREILTNDNSHELELLAMRSHSVRGDNPAPLTQMMSDSEFVVVMLLLRVETKCHEGKACSPFLAHNQEAELLEAGSEVVRSSRQVLHDGAITVLAETDHLVVLTNDL